MNTEDRCTIVGKVVVKPGQIPPMFFRWPNLFPNNLQQYRGAYTYAFIEGRQATTEDVPDILETLANTLWLPTGELIARDVVTAYVRHVHEQAKQMNVVDKVGYTTFKNTVIAALEVISDAAYYMRCKEVHGDLTLENIIIEPNRKHYIRLIDPAGPRDMINLSNDRGKLLQSLVMRWEERNLISQLPPWVNPNPLPKWANEFDWAFLVTHWVRLLRFWPELNTMLGFASLEAVRP